jgi:hypothetical protein
VIVPALTWEVEALELVRYRGVLQAPGQRFVMERRAAQRAIARRHVRAAGEVWLLSLPAEPPAGVFPVTADEQWILASGPSLLGVLDRIPRDAVTWGVNRVRPGAPQLAGMQLTYWLTCDADASRKLLPPAGSVRRWLRHDHAASLPPGEVATYRGLMVDGVSLDWRAGVSTCGGSAYAAMQLAVQSGARHLHLAGIDLGGGYFDGSHPGPEGRYAAQAPCFLQALECLEACGITWTHHGNASIEATTRGAA